jgi:NADH:ubiquinone oxidoreductase subunit 2 (subunit N)
MRWTAAVILRPVTFVLAIVAAVITGNRSDSFWYGLLAFFIAMGAGRVLGALIRGRTRRALYKAVWPAAATGYAFLFSSLGLPPWATFFVAWIAASLTRGAVPGGWRGGRWRITTTTRRIDLDELLP